MPLPATLRPCQCSCLQAPANVNKLSFTEQWLHRSEDTGLWDTQTEILQKQNFFSSFLHFYYFFLSFAVFRLLSFFISLHDPSFLSNLTLPTYKFIFLLVFLSKFILPHYFLCIRFFVRFYPIPLFQSFFLGKPSTVYFCLLLFSFLLFPYFLSTPFFSTF
jgi:hypothetical protein